MIRPAAVEDIPSLIPLLLLLFSIEEDFTFDAEKQEKGLGLLLQQDSSAVFLAEEDGEVVGMVTGQLLISTAEGAPALILEDLVVSALYRNKNIARSLLETLSSWARERGATRMQLLADVNNKDALNFYTKCDWAQTQLICLRKYLKE
ncbi:GNAT family N-acetyltransferase [Desulforhopalus sp. 52FAK]